MSPDQVRVLIRAGRLPAVRAGGRLLLRLSDVDAALSAATDGAHNPGGRTSGS